MLTAVLGLMSASQANAQLLALHSFLAAQNNGHGVFTNSDGVGPTAGLVFSDGVLYGTTYGGGLNGNGTVFAVNADGTGFQVLHTFPATGIGGQWKNSDGAQPAGGVVLSASTLYGTTTAGGANADGTIFAVNTDGTDFRTLHSFSGNDGYYVQAGLVFSDGVLYGTAAYGGAFGEGTLFNVNTNGTGFLPLHQFTGTNSDGGLPWGSLLLVGDTLYGTASSGGVPGLAGGGTVFSLNTNGGDFMPLHRFVVTGEGYLYYPSNLDGATPEGGLLLTGNTLYGTAYAGGTNAQGTIFTLATDGTGFGVLHTFHYNSPSDTSDGIFPQGNLALVGNTLYGTTANGGRSANGTIFSINAGGGGYAVWYDFSPTMLNTNVGAGYTNLDGAEPYAGLVSSWNTLYGTTHSGGSGGSGTVFSFSVPPFSGPPLTISQSGTNVVLQWPAGASGFTLQSTTNLVPAAWWGVFPVPVLVNGQNTVVNPIVSTQQFYQLVYY